MMKMEVGCCVLSLQVEITSNYTVHYPIFQAVVFDDSLAWPWMREQEINIDGVRSFVFIFCSGLAVDVRN